MSAFIVEDKTINKIVTKLAYDRDAEFLKRKFLEAGYDLETLKGRERLGWDMFGLNIRSVNMRYEDKPADKFRPLNYQFTLEGNHPKVNVFKSLECWLYQSCEGDCDESPLYKLFETVKFSWARDIISTMPEYQRAEWN